MSGAAMVAAKRLDRSVEGVGGTRPGRELVCVCPILASPDKVVSHSFRAGVWFIAAMRLASPLEGVDGTKPGRPFPDSGARRLSHP